MISFKIQSVQWLATTHSVVGPLQVGAVLIKVEGKYKSYIGAVVPDSEEIDAQTIARLGNTLHSDVAKVMFNLPSDAEFFL